MRRRAACAIVGVALAAHAAPRLRGMRIFGGTDESALPILRIAAAPGSTHPMSTAGSPYLTIELDVEADVDPQLTIEYVHCSREWREDREYFEDNFMHLRARDVRGELVPPQIRRYSYTVTTRCPDPANRVSIDLSGNYKVIVLAGGDTLGEGRFYAVDPAATLAVSTINDIDDQLSWRPGVHTVVVDAEFAPEIFESSILGADILIDHRLLDPVRVDPDDTTGRSRVDAVGSRVRFSAYDVIPGNSYRVIDCSDPAVYPPSSVPLSLVPRDITRGGIVTPDNHGAGFVHGVAATDADYLPIRFRLDAGGKRKREVFVVGAFNGWQPDIDNQMDYHPIENIYTGVVWMRRGMYDYQYVTGRWDAAQHRVVDQSWSELEGNTWSAPRTYTALIYYRDSRYGGIDRIVGCGHN